MTSRIHAAIDIGTVTCRLFVARVNGGVLEPLVREVAITNLGEGVDSSGVLKPEAIRRVVAKVGEYRAIIDSISAREGVPVGITAMATSASRDASNAGELVDQLSQLGAPLSVIEGTREAALSFAGASAAFAGQRAVVVDIGGGSTEVIAGVGGQAPEFAHSFNVGCRRVTERFLQSDPPSSEALALARTWIEGQMRPVLSNAAEHLQGIERVIAVAGTATSVVSVNLAMEEYDSNMVDGTVVGQNTLDAVYTRLRELPLAKRKQVVGLEPERASVIVAGLLILKVVLELLGKGEFTVSESDILQGMVLEQQI